MINIFNLLPKIFKTPLNKYKVEFLISLINYYNYYSMENCTIVLLCLNTISKVICNEEFRLDNFLTFNDANSTNLISQKLLEIKTNVNKDITKYLSDVSFKDKNGLNYLDMISSLLTLFANIKNPLEENIKINDIDDDSDKDDNNEQINKNKINKKDDEEIDNETIKKKQNKKKISSLFNSDFD